MKFNNYIDTLIDKYGSLERTPFIPTLTLRRDPARIEALKIFDPKGKLKDVANKVRMIEGSASLEEANLILLPDDCHLDKDHALWRGQIGTRIKAVSNMILCEGIDSKRWKISAQEQKEALGEGFEIGYDDDVTGWDDGHFYSTGLTELRFNISSLHARNIEALFKATKSQLESMTPDQLSELASTNKTLQELLAGRERHNEIVNARTDNLADCIEQKLAAAKGSRVIVVGGSGHLLDPRLIKRLNKNNIKFCAISTALGASGVQASSNRSLAQKIASLKAYYRV